MLGDVYKRHGISMMLAPNLAGSITIDMKDVTMSEVLASLRNIYGYEFKKTSYGFDVLTGELETKIFSINKLNVTRQGSSVMSVQSDSGIGTGRSQSASNLQTSNTDNFWVKLEETINLIIEDANSEETAVVVNPDSGLVVVRAYPNDLRKVAAFLDASQGINRRQVIIEAKVLEVMLDDRFATGIDWNIDGLDISQTSSGGGASGLPNSITAGVFADQIIGTINRHDSFSAVIRLLSSQGKVSVVSSPRIATMNNQKAVIKIGTDEYFATNVSTDTVSSSAVTSSTNLGLKSFFSGVALDVTPQIDKNKNITLHIHPIISSVKQEEKTFTVQDSQITLPLAKSTIRESDSIVNAKSGQVVVIGGLMQRAVDSNRSKLPVPSDTLAAITDAASAKSDKVIRSELVILLRPVVLDVASANDSIKEYISGFDNLIN